MNVVPSDSWKPHDSKAPQDDRVRRQDVAKTDQVLGIKRLVRRGNPLVRVHVMSNDLARLAISGDPLTFVLSLSFCRDVFGRLSRLVGHFLSRMVTQTRASRLRSRQLADAVLADQ